MFRFLRNHRLLRHLLNLCAPTRSGKPSDLVAAGLGVQNATLIDLLPGANLGKDVVAGGVQVRVLSTVSLNILEIEFVCIH